MAKRIIRGYWDCPYCGTKGVDGLIDRCPNCGTGKPADTKYYMKDKKTVSDEELLKAGIGLDENDGKHKEWVCPYCGQLNNWGDQICVSCGASKDTKEKEYGDPVVKKGEDFQPVQPVRTVSNKNKKRLYIIAAIALLFGILFFPHTKKETVTNYHWETVVTVEESRIVDESDWSLPSGAELIKKQEEIHHYDQVLDHYETEYVTRSRSVISGYEEYCTYSDNGNGTFTEDCSSEPVYETEYYTDTEQVPVYVSVPRYQTKYYYKILRWFEVEDYKESGEDKNPYYATNYTLEENMRDTTRTTTYYVTFDTGNEEKVTESTYQYVETGMSQSVTRNLLGMEYSRTELE